MQAPLINQDIQEKDMKLPTTKTFSTHQAPALNTMTLTGLSVLWAVMLNLISPWYLILAGFTLLSGWGSEIYTRASEEPELVKFN